MKKLLIVLLALGLLVLAGCGEGEKPDITAEPTALSTTQATTTEPFTLDPNRPMAIMEPVQGGPMLYTFTGRNGKLGLINQDGELVAPPQYEQPNYGDYSAEFSLRAEYTRDANGRIDGITLQKGEKGGEFVHYTLDGKSRQVKGIPDVGGRYAILDGGLYDVENDRWKLASKEGQKITETYVDRVFLQQAGANGTSKLYVYILEDERIQELPEGVHAYFAELGWYRSGYEQGSPQGIKYYYKYYDQDLNLLPEETWKPHIEPGPLLDQNGNELPYARVSNLYGQCWVGCKENERDGTGTILDANFNPLYTTKPGEEIILLNPVPYDSRWVGLVVQDVKGNVVKTFDEYGRPMQSKNEARFYHDPYLFGGTVYKLKDGKWTALDLRQFIKPDVEDHCAVAMVVTEDWVIVITQFFEDTDEIFAIDWTGKPYENCPLMPFTKKGGYLHGAGEQGPNYFWVEHEGKRGYVNIKGEWLFVE